MVTAVHATTRRQARNQTGWWVFGTGAIGLAVFAYVVAGADGQDTLRGLIVAPIVVLISFPLLVRIRSRDHGFDLAGVVFAAIGVKLCAVYARFWMVDSLYDGTGDSTAYDIYGKQFAPQFRQFDFDVDAGLPIPGTGFLRVLTGAVYAIFGSDRFTGFIIFGMLSLVGCWFFYRAFVAAVPNGDHKRYAVLVFFWPSLLFWPSAIGKEAWMILSLGLASWGAANLYRRHANGFVMLGLGILGAAMPRPHIAIVVLAAAAVGLTMASLFGAGAGGRRVGAITKVAGVLFLMVAGSLLAPKVATFLNIDDVGGSGFSESLEDVSQQTSQGGSSFTAPEISSPVDYPWALITVLFRPFPYEISGGATAVSAAEGVLLVILMFVSARKLVRLPAELVRNAYVAYAAAFAFMFVYVFAFIGNFGILARQRSQLLPFLFVLIALPTGISKVKERFMPDDRPHRERPIADYRVPTIAPPRGR